MTRNAPAISVLLPFRDEEESLPLALRSLARQTLEDFEVLCLDDGSRDASSAIAREWSRKDSRFEWIPLNRRGVVHALNKGIDRSRAAFLARMDADDVSHPRRLELQWAYLNAHPETGVLGCRVAGFPARALREGYRHYLAWLNALVTPDDIAREIFVESPLVHPTAMMRRHVVQRLGGYREFEGPEDYDLWLRCFMDGVTMAKAPQILYFWRERHDRLSRTNPRYHRSRFWELKAGYLARYLAKSDHIRKRPILVWGQRLAGRLARRLLADGIHVVGFININPSRQGRTRLGLPVSSPEVLAKTPEAFVICAVSTRGARDDIRALCVKMGLVEGRDYLMAG